MRYTINPLHTKHYTNISHSNTLYLIVHIYIIIILYCSHTIDGTRSKRMRIGRMWVGITKAVSFHDSLGPAYVAFAIR